METSAEIHSTPQAGPSLLREDMQIKTKVEDEGQVRTTKHHNQDKKNHSVRSMQPFRLFATKHFNT